MMKNIAALCLLGLCGAIAAIPASAANISRDARCRVWQTNAIDYNGACHFWSEDGDSFSLTFPTGEGDGDLRRYHITRIRVRVIRTGVAEVSEPDRLADRRWGRALRSRLDRACWTAAALAPGEAGFWMVCAR